MRCSIVGVAVNVVTRCRSIRSTMRAGVELLQQDELVTGQQLRQRGEPVRVVERRRHQHHLRARRRRSTRWRTAAGPTPSHSAGLSITMTLGVPVDPLLQMPWVWGDLTSGRATTASSAVASQPGEVVALEIDLGVDDREHPLALPVGQVPPHGHRYRAELPGRDDRQDQLRGVAEAERHPVAPADAAGVEGLGDLVRATVDVPPGQGLLGAVDRREDQCDAVGLLVGELGEPSAVGDGRGGWGGRRCILV